MKKLLVLAMGMAAIVACNNEKPVPVVPDGGQNDSLQRIIEQKDNEINDIMATLNEIQEGFREISEAEGRVSVAKAGERADKAQQIRENIQFISQRMAQNRELINKLKSQMQSSTLKADQLQKVIETMTKELQDKDTQLTQLRDELDKKDIHIAELDETINTQDKQLNTAWYVFGTKKELKEQGVLNDGQVLRGNFNKNYFTKVDIRNFGELKLYSKDAKLMTTHPSSSYSLTRDANKQYILRITNPQLFWSTSKYLVVQVK